MIAFDGQSTTTQTTPHGSEQSFMNIIFQQPARATDEELAVLERLIQIAQEPTSGQSRRVAEFLLAWWDAPTFGGFNFSEAWGLDHQTTLDMAVVFSMITRIRVYPDQLGYAPAFKKILAIWDQR